MTRKVGDSAETKAAGNRGKGRKKGVPNKVTGAIKDMVREALELAGGVEYLHKQADENPKAFLSLVGRMVPLEANLHHDGQVSLEQMITASLERKS